MNAARLWGILFSKDHLKEHYVEKIRTHASVGLDKVSTNKFEENIDEEIETILRKVNNGTYRFTRYRQLLFSKGVGKEPRVISIPTIRDKLVTSVLNELIVNIFGSQGVSSLPQVLIADIINELPQFECYFKLDISKFYSSIDHYKLLRILKKKIRKNEIVSLIEKAIKTETISIPIKEKKPQAGRTIGIPEGLPISNALANIFMSDIDSKYRKMAQLKYYRYVDDILVLVNYDEYQSIREQLVSDISSKLLAVNLDKIENGTTNKPFSYLGYYMCNNFITVRQSSLFRLEESIEQLVGSCAKGNIKYLEWKLNLKITGFILDNNKYGWLFFYSQMDDMKTLFHLDWFVCKLIDRYGLTGKIKTKKFSRAFFEIRKRLHRTNYIPNLNTLTIKEKRKLIAEIKGQVIDDISDSKIEYFFRKIMKREIQDIERDVEHIS